MFADKPCADASCVDSLLSDKGLIDAPLVEAPPAYKGLSDDHQMNTSRASTSQGDNTLADTQQGEVKTANTGQPTAPYVDSQEEVLIDQALYESKPSNSVNSSLSEGAECRTEEHSFPYIKVPASTSNCIHRDTSEAYVEVRRP